MITGMRPRCFRETERGEEGGGQGQGQGQGAGGGRREVSRFASLAGSLFYSLQTPKRFSCPRVRVSMMCKVVVYPQVWDGKEKGNAHGQPARLIDTDVSRITAARVRTSSRSFPRTRIEPSREQAIKQIRVSVRRPSAVWRGRARRGAARGARSVALLLRRAGPSTLHIPNATASRENGSATARRKLSSPRADCSSISD